MPVRFNSGEIAAEAERLRSDLAAHPDALQVSMAGSYRRRKEIVRDLDFIVATKAPEAITEFFVGHPLVESVIAHGPTKTSVRLQSGIQCDLRVVTTAEYPFRPELFYREQGAQHRDAKSRAATRLDLERISARAAVRRPIRDRKKDRKTRPRQIPEIREEAELYRALDLDFIPPELRENCGEFEAAEAGKLPRLIEMENLRGTFHCHTTASDGHNSLEEMAAAAQELGLQYLGIADHSRSSVQAHGLDAARLQVQDSANPKTEQAH